MNSFIRKLQEEIGRGLPGTEVQWEMASSDRFVKNFPRVPRDDSASASVLILLYPVNGIIHTLFIQRPDYKGVHGGQISFPGGKSEKGDKSLIETALREAEEETGVDANTINIIGTLTSLYIPVSNINVTPVAGWTNTRPSLRPEKNEVLFIIEAPLEPFLEYSILKQKPFDIRGENIEIRYFDYQGHVIWGATAMMLHELLVIINRANLSPVV